MKSTYAIASMMFDKLKLVFVEAESELEAVQDYAMGGMTDSQTLDWVSTFDTLEIAIQKCAEADMLIAVKAVPKV